MKLANDKNLESVAGLTNYSVDRDTYCSYSHNIFLVMFNYCGV